MTPAWLTDTVTPNLDRALQYTHLWGLEAVVLRTVGGAQDVVPFVNEEKLRRRLWEQEVPVVAVMPGLFQGTTGDRLTWMNEVAAFPEIARFCQRIDCSCVVVSGFAAGSAQEEAANVLRQLGDRAARAKVRIAVQNEAGMATATGAALADLLAAVDHEAVRAAWHPAEALAAGEDPAAGLAALGEDVALVFCADGSPTPSGWQYGPFGAGQVDWEAQFRALKARGFAGTLCLEVHAEPRPRQGLRDATAMIRAARVA